MCRMWLNFLVPLGSHEIFHVGKAALPGNQVSLLFAINKVHIDPHCLWKRNGEQKHHRIFLYIQENFLNLLL